MGQIMLWLLCTLVGLSSVLYPLVIVAYQRRLSYKRLEIDRILENGSTFKAYAKAFGEIDPKEVVDKLFELYYAWRTYVLPVALNMIVSAGACAIVLIRFGWSFGFPGIETRIVGI